MTQDEIIRMAQEAGLQETFYIVEELERFANLLAEATKEKAAKVCEGFTANVRHQSIEAYNFSLDCSKAIREMK